MDKMQKLILELAYDKLMDNHHDTSDNFDIEKVENQEIDFINSIINFDYTIGGVVYSIQIVLKD